MRGLLLLGLLWLLAGCGDAPATPAVDTRVMLTPGPMTDAEGAYFTASGDNLATITAAEHALETQVPARTGSAYWQAQMQAQIVAVQTATTAQDAVPVPPRLAPVAAHVAAADAHYRAFAAALATDLGAQPQTPPTWQAEWTAAQAELAQADKLLTEFDALHPLP